MDLITVAIPPDPFVERAERIGGSDLFWLRPEPFAVSCQPERAHGLLKLVVLVDGEGVARQAGRQALLGAGTFTWLDPDAPFELALTRGRRLLLQLPRAEVRRRHPEIDLRTALTRGHDHAGERVFGELLRRLADEGPGMAAGNCVAAANVVMEAVGLCARADVVDAGRRRIERALASVELRLGDPGLQPEDIAREQRVSRRYLDQLLRPATGHTLATYIRARRLERAAHDLETRPGDLAAEVAARWGFRDASHFTRLFRRHYAATPTVYRQARGITPRSPR